VNIAVAVVPKIQRLEILSSLLACPVLMDRVHAPAVEVEGQMVGTEIRFAIVAWVLLIVAVIAKRLDLSPGGILPEDDVHVLM
jgi:hypothetical protein